MRSFVSATLTSDSGSFYSTFSEYTGTKDNLLEERVKRYAEPLREKLHCLFWRLALHRASLFEG